MDVIKVFQQMVIMFSLMGVGFFLTRKKFFSEKAPVDFSKIIAEVCNPALLICKALDKEGTATREDLLFAVLIAAIYYLVLIAISYLLPRLVGAKKSEMKFYKMLTVYSNMGFMGIPLISAVLGSTAIAYLSIFIMVFNVLIYTHGMKVLTNEGGGVTKKLEWRKMLNPGMIAAILSIVIILMDISLPKIVDDAVQYIGASTTFLSMFVIGMALAQISFRELFTDTKLYRFIVLRYMVIPAIVAFCLKPIMNDANLLGVIVLTLALPAGNLALMMAEQYNLDTKLLTKSIVLTTLCSLVTVTLAAWVLAL